VGLGDDGGVTSVAKNMDDAGVVVDAWRQHGVECRGRCWRERSRGTCCPPCWGVSCPLCPKVGTGGAGGVADVWCGVDDRRSEVFLRSCQRYRRRPLPWAVLCNYCLKWISRAGDEEVDLMTLAGDAYLYHVLGKVASVVIHGAGVPGRCGAEVTKDSLVIERPLDCRRILS
jgi:hypothetical protein